MKTSPAPIAHLLAAADAERARYRELCSVICERIRQAVETNHGSIPPALAETVGAEALRQMIATSDRIQSIYTAVDAYQETGR
jgi:hypothetical protein